MYGSEAAGAIGMADAGDAQAVAALGETRRRTLALVASVSDEDLERVHSPLMSPLVWDLGHIAAFEDLWLVHRFGGRSLLREGLAEIYDAFETPRAARGELPFLGPAKAREYLDEVRARSLEVIAGSGVGDGVVAELIVRHEQQHSETMLQTLQLAHLKDYELADPAAPIPAAGHRPAPAFTGLEMAEIPSGYLSFVEGGGYERREWWSDEGWAWKEDHDITRPAGWTADLRSAWRLDGLQSLDPAVVHISWFEADAFARAHAGRLPTEAEWEKAATWDQESGHALSHPWGEQPPVVGVHVNLDQRAGGPVAAGSFPEGASPYGCLRMLGDVWEWTASEFRGYPGFVASPYREYSEVFFGPDYRVLRGGSWATRPRVGTATFRNWDYPQRRQIFSGLRIAKDL